MNPDIEKYKKQIAKLEAKIEKLQNSCKHENVNAVCKGNSGWDYENYWVEVKCLDCDKYMSFDSEDEPEQYRFYSLKKYK